MADQKFTPGPWRLRDEDGPPITDVMVGDRLLATAYPDHFKSGNPYKGLSDEILRSYAEAEANARLIAAAPDLYTCLTAALPYIRSEWEAVGDLPDKCVLETAEAILAKARGEG